MLTRDLSHIHSTCQKTVGLCGPLGCHIYRTLLTYEIWHAHSFHFPLTCWTFVTSLIKIPLLVSELDYSSSIFTTLYEMQTRSSDENSVHNNILSVLSLCQTRGL